MIESNHSSSDIPLEGSGTHNEYGGGADPIDTAAFGEVPDIVAPPVRRDEFELDELGELVPVSPNSTGVAALEHEAALEPTAEAQEGGSNELPDNLPAHAPGASYDEVQHDEEPDARPPAIQGGGDTPINPPNGPPHVGGSPEEEPDPNGLAQIRAFMDQYDLRLPDESDADYANRVREVYADHGEAIRGITAIHDESEPSPEGDAVYYSMRAFIADTIRDHYAAPQPQTDEPELDTDRSETPMPSSIETRTSSDMPAPAGEPESLLSLRSFALIRDIMVIHHLRLPGEPDMAYANRVREVYADHEELIRDITARLYTPDFSDSEADVAYVRLSVELLADAIRSHYAPEAGAGATPTGRDAPESSASPRDRELSEEESRQAAARIARTRQLMDEYDLRLPGEGDEAYEERVAAAAAIHGDRLLALDNFRASLHHDRRATDGIEPEIAEEIRNPESIIIDPDLPESRRLISPPVMEGNLVNRTNELVRNYTGLPVPERTIGAVDALARAAANLEILEDFRTIGVHGPIYPSLLSGSDVNAVLDAANIVQGQKFVDLNGIGIYATGAALRGLDAVAVANNPLRYDLAMQGFEDAVREGSLTERERRHLIIAYRSHILETDISDADVVCVDLTGLPSVDADPEAGPRQVLSKIVRNAPDGATVILRGTTFYAGSRLERPELELVQRAATENEHVTVFRLRRTTPPAPDQQ